MTAYASVESAVEAMKQGAYDYIIKPFNPDDLEHTIRKAIEHKQLVSENQQLRTKIDELNLLHEIVGQSDATHRLLEQVGMVSASDTTVLIRGESGTGKELVARAIHANSERRYMPIVVVNCGALSEGVLESELFGHEKGAFTGAQYRRKGKFEMADGGTLFLDEIGDMPLALQAKLLRFLQERRLERIGGRESISVDVRLICATNQKLEKLIAEQKFREDLFYRINDVRIELPPLRDREGDVAVLAQHFLNTFNRAFFKQIAGFTGDAQNAMAAHTWPGNVRELENRVKRAVIMSENKRISAQDLDLADIKAAPRSLDLKTEVEKLERKLASEALAVAEGNVSKAAKILGVSRPHLYNLLGQG
jgi:two-component system NtrC family response regulator